MGLRTYENKEILKDTESDNQFICICFNLI